MHGDAPHGYRRYVAIGDSSTEGLIDPDGRGGYRGWADRLAGRIAREEGSLLYANLAIRGRRTPRIREEQLEPALDMRPDLVTLFSGSNDAVAKAFDPDALATDLLRMQRRLIDAGAVVVTFTLPDLEPVMPLGRRLAPRVRRLNETLRSVAAQSGAILVDFNADPAASDRRLWHEDGFHANSLGHARIAAALAEALGYPDVDGVLSQPLPPAKALGPAGRLLRDGRWLLVHFLPWVLRHARGRSSGDEISAKRPSLQPIEVPIQERTDDAVDSRAR